MRAPTRRRRARWLRLLAGLFVASALLLIGEGVCRGLRPQVPTWKGADGEGVVMVGSDTRLWGMAPGVKWNGEKKAMIAENGLRAPQPEGPRRPGEHRILVLGDSTWFGHGVGNTETFPAQLQAQLQAAGQDVTVVNGGIPGYSTEQSRILLEEEGWALDPDLLLVGNLWSDNNNDNFRDIDLLRTQALFARNPLSRSALFQVVAGAVDRAGGGEGARVITWTRDSHFPEKGVRRVALQRYAENLDTMIREAAARGIGAVLISPCNIGLVKGLYGNGAAWDSYFEAQKLVAGWHGIPLVRTLPAMKASGADPESLFIDQMHPSPEGHAIFARAALEGLQQAGWPEAPLLGRADAPFPAADLVDRGLVYTDGPPNAMSPQTQLFSDAQPSP